MNTINTEISEIQKTLERFSNIVPKTRQGLRLFNAFYKIRFEGYKRLGNKRLLNIFKSKEVNDLEREKTIAILKTNNERERKVFLELYLNAYNELKPNIDLISNRWKKESTELKIMQTYFENIFNIQKDFLDKEILFLAKAISKEEFADFANEYFTKLEQTSNNIAKQYGAFYSPISFEKKI
ncbi:MAG: hypothetical protein ACP5N1_03160 [Candidatus Woesearchaeota archaeon]